MTKGHARRHVPSRGSAWPHWARQGLGGPLGELNRLFMAASRPEGRGPFQRAYESWFATGAGRATPSPRRAFCLQTSLALLGRWHACPPHPRDPDSCGGLPGDTLVSRWGEAARRWPLAYFPSVFDWWLHLPRVALAAVEELLPPTGDEEAPFPPLPLLRNDRDLEASDLMGAVYRSLFPPAARQTLGEFYTPASVAGAIIDRLGMEDWLDRQGPLLLDPACGSGVFLAAACRRIAHLRGENVAASLLLTGRLAGIDIHPLACVAARTRLNRLLPNLHEHLPPSASLFPGVVQGDALLHPAPPAGGDDSTPPEDRPIPGEAPLLERLRRQGPFRFVVGNPPFVRARRMPRAYREEIRRRFPTAKGAWDLSIPFIELAVRWTQPYGETHLIITEKVLGADYGRPLREWLDRVATWHVRDLPAIPQHPSPRSGPEALFDGSLVNPVLLCVRREPNPAPAPPRRSRQVDGDAADLLSAMERGSVPLGSLGTLRGGVMGFDYTRAVHCLEEGTPGPGRPAVIGTGQVLPYWAAWQKPIRLLGKRRHGLVLAGGPATGDGSGQTPFSEDGLEFFRRPKLLIRGVARRLTAAWDPHGMGFLVAVFGFCPGAVDPWALLELLNSPVVDFYARARLFAGQIPRGSWRFPKSFLQDLPVPAAIVGAAPPSGSPVETGMHSCFQPPCPGPDGAAAAVSVLRNAALRKHRDPFAPWRPSVDPGRPRPQPAPADPAVLTAAAALYGFPPEGVAPILEARRRLGLD